MELPKGNLTNEYVSKNISRFDIGEKTSFVGIVVNTLLSVLKIVFGLMTGAISVVETESTIFSTAQVRL